MKPTACLTIDSTKVDADKLTALEEILYGTDGENGKEPKLPTPKEVIAIINGNANSDNANAEG